MSAQQPVSELCEPDSYPGNFGRDDAAQFLKSFGDVLQPSDSMLIGVDGCDDPAKV